MKNIWCFNKKDINESSFRYIKQYLKNQIWKLNFQIIVFFGRNVQLYEEAQTEAKINTPSWLPWKTTKNNKVTIVLNLNGKRPPHTICLGRNNAVYSVVVTKNSILSFILFLFWYLFLSWDVRVNSLRR